MSSQLDQLGQRVARMRVSLNTRWPGNDAPLTARRRVLASLHPETLNTNANMVRREGYRAVGTNSPAPEVRAVLDSIPGIIAECVTRSRVLLRVAKTEAQAVRALDVAGSAHYRVARAILWARVRQEALNVQTTADRLNRQLVWIAEDDACPDCKPLDGKPLPAGHPLPPLHPNCRCEVVLLAE